MSQQHDHRTDRQTSNGGGGLFTFLLGIAAGAAAGYYLSTEEGRRMRNRLGEQANAYGAQGRELARDGSHRANESLQTAIKQGREYVHDLSTTVKSRVDDASAQARARVDETSARAKSRAESLRHDAKLRVSEISESAREKAAELSDAARAKAAELTESAKTKANEVGARAKTKADQTSSSFQEGVARGKARLSQQKAEIDNLVQGKTDGEQPAAGN